MGAGLAMAIDDPGQGSPQRFSRRSAGRFLLYVAIVTAMAFAAWQVRCFLQMPSGRGDTSKTTPTVGADGLAPLPSGGLERWLDEPLAVSLLKPCQSDPGGFTPPTGARRVDAYRGQVAGRMQEHARYKVPGSRDAAAVHYRTLLGEASFRLLQDAAEGDIRRLIWNRGRTAVSVVLRNDLQKAKMVSVVVIVSSAASSSSSVREP